MRYFMIRKMNSEDERVLEQGRVSIPARTDFTLCETGPVTRSTVQDQSTAQGTVSQRLTVSLSECLVKL